MRAALGTSIIAPTSLGFPCSTPSLNRSDSTSSSNCFACLNSSRVEIIGNIIPRLYLYADRKIALNCVLNISGLSRLILIPLQPRNGLSSNSLSSAGILSPPISTVLIITLSGAKLSETFEYIFS